MGTVLLYNLNDADKRMRIKLILFRLGLSARDVRPEEFGCPLGLLLGREGFAPAEADGSFAEEMLVMHELSQAQFSSLLNALRQGRVPVALKAVVTDTNIAWSSLRLHSELAAEHAAMQKHARSVHRR